MKVGGMELGKSGRIWVKTGDRFIPCNYTARILRDDESIKMLSVSHSPDLSQP